MKKSTSEKAERLITYGFAAFVGLVVLAVILLIGAAVMGVL